MPLFEALSRIVGELRGASTIVVHRAEIWPGFGPIPNDYIEELREECEDFELDEALRATYAEIDGVAIDWSVRDGSIGGSLALPGLLNLARPAFMEDDVSIEGQPVEARPDGGPYPALDEVERRFLLQLHHLEVRDGGRWTALRSRRGAAPELWMRIEPGSRVGCDYPLRHGFEIYLQTMLASRGASGWPMLMLETNSVPTAEREGLRRQLRILRQSLRALSEVPTASEDAASLLQRVNTIDEELSRPSTARARPEGRRLA